MVLVIRIGMHHGTSHFDLAMGHGLHSFVFELLFLLAFSFPEDSTENASILRTDQLSMVAYSKRLLVPK
jgi:hypothetical protein